MTSWGFVLLSFALLAAAGWLVHVRWHPVRLGTRELATAGTLAAIGTLTAHLFWIPTGVAKAFPVQHAINVLAGVLLGPVPAAMIAFAVGLLRNLLGTGTLLAFPGGMIGAFLAGSMYRLTGRVEWAVAGELFGTGIVGGLAAYPVVIWVMGHPAAPFFYVVPFLLSSGAGAAIAYGLLAALQRTGAVVLQSRRAHDR
ncbi:MAG: energy coupling factor transporter S component ThiW [Bacillota bacterium]